MDYVGNNSYDIINMTITESERKQRPTRWDYIKAQRLLRDFGLRKEIPQFNTIAELDRYTSGRIKNFLSKF
jgi:hypothetical protein